MVRKKVAILTQPLGHNYGGILQAYALQTYLKKLGCEVETLDRRAPEVEQVSVKPHVLNLARLLLGRIKSIPTAKKQARVLEELARFRDDRITMSSKITGDQELREYYRGRNFDAFIVGSDQVWRPRYSPCIPNFFLDFLDDIESPAKRIAYAASFGINEWEYSSELTEKCKSLAQEFDAISVRESSAVDLCKEMLGVSAEFLVDPTLLLEPAEYEPLINECGENANAGCVLSYVLDPAPEKHSIAANVGNSLGITVFSIKPKHSVAQVRTKDFYKCRFPSVESWLQAFQGANFIVTDSFHGAVFSILFNKPFIAVGNPVRGMARFESLLSQFGLSDRLVESPLEVTPELVHNKIEWDSVNIRRAALANMGHQFLATHLLGE
ncbi:MurB family protein [Halovibrio variabilis]|uniref:MurB family protein n=1 Tax=Halovibrio variabilis TaxID=31910 RepID=A0A511USN1_9GAMM|nr:polysaccharide pyruvyl transferase family protein [Halovibrio variabilis]GEN29585.1 MurB family protein [Halovibrio variabilis]